MSDNYVTLWIIGFSFPLWRITRIRISTREINAWFVIFIILLVVSIFYVSLIYNKKYVYDDSILNSISRKIPIAVIIWNTAVVGGLLASLLPILPTSFSDICMYIAISLFLLSLAVQIYYYSKMKIAYFFIMLVGIFLVEFFLIPPDYALYTAKGAMETFALVAAMWLASNIVIYKNI